jgi:hypothetical protein
MAVLRRLMLVAACATAGSLLVAVTPSPASSRTADERCRDRAPIPASPLRPRAPAPGCSMVGRVVFTRHVRVVVPPPRMSVSGEGLSRHGDVAGLTVTNTGTRVVAVRTRADRGAYLVAPRTAHTTAVLTMMPVTTTPWPSATLTPMSALVTTPVVANPPVVLAAPVGPAVTSPPACQDRAFNLEHHHWVTELRWSDNLSHAPPRLHKAVLAKQIKRANANMRTGRNTCGKPRVRTPAAHFLGRTSVRPNIRTSPQQVTCGAYNKRNVVGFGNLPGDLLGWTCFWWVGHGRMAAADVMMDNGPGLVTHVPPGCVNRWDFEGAVTHEFGHVYGLAHTGSGHDNLTMEHTLQPCSPYARTLGLGDWLGMKRMYGVR